MAPQPTRMTVGRLRVSRARLTSLPIGTGSWSTMLAPAAQRGPNLDRALAAGPWPRRTWYATGQHLQLAGHGHAGATRSAYTCVDPRSRHAGQQCFPSWPEPPAVHFRHRPLDPDGRRPPASLARFSRVPDAFSRTGQLLVGHARVGSASRFGSGPAPATGPRPRRT